MFEKFPSNLQDAEQFSSNVHEILELNFVRQTQEVPTHKMTTGYLVSF